MINLEQIKQKIAHSKTNQVFRLVVHWYLFNSPSLTALLKGLGFLASKQSQGELLERKTQ